MEERTTEVSWEEAEVQLNKELDSMFPGWQPKKVEEESSFDFDTPCYGSYNAEFNTFKTKSGKDVIPAQYAIKDDGTAERITLNFKVYEDVKGDVSGNRYLRRTFFMGTNKFADDPTDEFAGIKKLIDALKGTGAIFSVTSAKDYKQFATDLCKDLAGLKVRVSQYKYNEKPCIKLYKLKTEGVAKTEEAVGNPFSK